jgi:hypothetical protein
METDKSAEKNDELPETTESVVEKDPFESTLTSNLETPSPATKLTDRASSPEALLRKPYINPTIRDREDEDHPSDPRATTAAPTLTNPSPVAAVSNPSTSEKNSFFEWFWRGKTIAAAKANQQSKQISAHMLEVQRMMDIAERAVFPVEPLQWGPSYHAALVLYREVLLRLWWMSFPEMREKTTMSALFHEPSSKGWLVQNLGTESELEAWARSWEQWESPQVPEVLEEMDKLLVEQTRTYCTKLYDRYPNANNALQKAVFQRWWRLTAALVAIVGLVVGGVSLGQRATRGPDLLIGKPWKTSSAYKGMDVANQVCDGAKVDFFFCTIRERHPWIEFDLGKEMRFRSMEVYNRSDCCPERAWPLVVEVSSDEKKWTQVAVRNEPFRVWKPKFQATQARYLRLRVNKISTFHLENVVLHP